MKALLAPLLPTYRFCKHCMRIEQRLHPDVWSWFYECARMPPLGRFTPDHGFEPDMPVLLMVDEFIIDADARDRLMTARAPWMGEWPTVVAALQAEGSLTSVDLRALDRDNARVRSAMTRRDLRDPDRWSHAMFTYNSIMTGANGAFTGVPSESSAYGWEFDPTRRWETLGPDGQYHLLPTLLGADPTTLDETHLALREGALAELSRDLGNVNAVMAAAESLDAVPMFWATYAGYAAEKGYGPTTDASDGAHKFFEVAFPESAPSTTKQLVKLRGDPRIRSLRDEIERAYETSDVLDPEYPKRALYEALRIDGRVGNMRKIIGWVSTVIGIIPVPAVGLAATVVGEVAGTRIEARMRRSHDWLYLISNAVGGS